VGRSRLCPVVAAVVTLIAASMLLVPFGVASAQSGGSEFTMTGVVCTAKSSCLAVGDYADSTGASRPLSERWNGSSWQKLSIRGPRFSGLNALSCPAVSNCVAVGFSRYGFLAEEWNGTTWTKTVVPGPVGSIDTALLSVSCPAVNNCMAAGYYLNGASTWLTLTESWDGSTWSMVPSPDPSGVTGSELLGVSCPGANSCEAVGYSFDSSGNSATLAETWDGGSWSLVTSPNSASGSEDVLDAVSCVSSSQCTAVGQYAALNGSTPPLVEVWDGTGWSLVAGVTGNGQLDGIDCTGISTCMAVGSYANHEIEGAWTNAAIAKPAGTYGPVLASVSCASSSHCIAVGFATGKSSDTTYNLSEIWKGTSWALLSTPN
jgi:hypothetical protein